jgi:hypothetical protein
MNTKAPRLRRAYDYSTTFGSISGYELGTRVPPLPVVLRYAQAARVCSDVLLDDDLDLPAKLPAKPKHRT